MSSASSTRRFSARDSNVACLTGRTDDKMMFASSCDIPSMSMQSYTPRSGTPTFSIRLYFAILTSSVAVAVAACSISCLSFRQTFPDFFCSRRERVYLRRCYTTSCVVGSPIDYATMR